MARWTALCRVPVKNCRLWVHFLLTWSALSALAACSDSAAKRVPAIGQDFHLKILHPFDLRREGERSVAHFRCGKPDPMGLVLRAPSGSALPVQVQWQMVLPNIPAIELPNCPQAFNPEATKADGEALLRCEVPKLNDLLPPCGNATDRPLLFQVVLLYPDQSQTILVEKAVLTHDPTREKSPCETTHQKAKTAQNQKDYTTAAQAYLNAGECFVAENRQAAAYIDFTLAASLIHLYEPSSELPLSAAVKARLLEIPQTPPSLTAIRARLMVAQLARDDLDLQGAWQALRMGEDIGARLDSDEAALRIALGIGQWAMAANDLVLAQEKGSRCLELGRTFSEEDALMQECVQLNLLTKGRLGLSEAVLELGFKHLAQLRQAEGNLERDLGATNLAGMLLDVPAPSPLSLTKQTALLTKLLMSAPPASQTDTSGERLAPDPRIAPALVAAEHSLQHFESPSAAAYLAEALVRDNLPRWRLAHRRTAEVLETLNLSDALLKHGDTEGAAGTIGALALALSLEPALPTSVTARVHRQEAVIALERKDVRGLDDSLRKLNELPAPTRSLEDGELDYLEASQLLLHHDVREARRRLEDVTHALNTSAIRADLAGYAPTFLLFHRAPFDRLLELIKPYDRSGIQDWLNAFELTRAPMCEPESANPIGSATPSNPSAPSTASANPGIPHTISGDYASFVKAAEQRMRHLAVKDSLSLNARSQWEMTERALNAQETGAYFAAMRCSLPKSKALDLSTLQSQLQADTEIWVWVSLTDKLQGVRITRSEVTPMMVPMSRGTLLQERERLFSALEAAPQNGHWPAPPSFLSLLVPSELPHDRRILLILDPLLEDLPLEAAMVEKEPLISRVKSISQGLSLENLMDSLAAPRVNISGHETSGRILLLADEAHRTSASQVADAMRPLWIRLEVFVGPQATRSLFLPEARSLLDNSAEYVVPMTQGIHILHVAVHGHSEAYDPTSSQLQLSTHEVLKAPDLRMLPLKEGLVFLAACESGRGGSSGSVLARAALTGGARQVVVSRWLLNSAFSTRLESTFYTLLPTSAGPAEALTRAKQQLLRESPATPPASLLELSAGLIVIGQPD